MSNQIIVVSDADRAHTKSQSSIGRPQATIIAKSAQEAELEALQPLLLPIVLVVVVVAVAPTKVAAIMDQGAQLRSDFFVCQPKTSVAFLI